MKAGTTQLDALLAANPSVQPRRWKECRLLTEPSPTPLAYRALHDLSWRRKARERRTGRPERVGDASPYDLFHPRAPQAASRLVPDARFVILLRDPAFRAWSHHRHAVRHGFETLDFAAAIDAEAGRLDGEEARLARDPTAVSGPHQHWSYLARGRYAGQLTRWFDAFPRDRFLIVFAETFFRDPAEVLGRVEDHLGLPRSEGAAVDEIANRGDGSRPDDATLRDLRDRFAEDDRRLGDLLEESPPWRSGGPDDD